MSEIRLNIDGREVVGFEGQTVLEIARDNGIDIPTLCHDDRVKMYGSCGVCVVEAENSPKLMRSCSTYGADGMIIRTNTDRVRASRQTALELLLSDHTGDCRPPCVLACPGQTDCQGYVGLIANGEYREALKLVKDKIPLPASIGRVCPHPCEEACRRKLVEEPISIMALKRFVGDLDLEGGELYTAEIGESTGKKVAVVGGGPGGLTAAYFLRVQGHEVTVYDAMPAMGGMLRYGIPEYRLPKKLLGEECDAIRGMGVEFRNNVRIGKDLSLDYLRSAYDAVIVAVGAWTSSGLRCKGEELSGVIGGIDFLRDVALNNTIFTGRKIAVVGGGNTAMDCTRTAIRLGAAEVYNVYRRTKNEMPAEAIEIEEAEEEGAVFKNLTNPNEVLGDENGKVRAVRLQIMELGEPDASGRRAPVPVEGKEETIEVDTVIVAIGQKLNGAGLDGIELTKWGTIAADEHTFRTSLDGVFAVGDATNKGADIAISAIGEAKKAAEMVGRYLHGEALTYETPYLVTSEKTAEDLAGKEKQPRIATKTRRAESRRKDFLEITERFTEEEARREASRCLECGCHDYFECKLIDYANRYKVKPEKYDGAVHHREPLANHPYIRRNPDKCILCGLCVRICDEVVGATALGLVARGFDTVVSPALDIDLADTDCIACGQCVSVCPTGALTETMMIPKQVPTREMAAETTCSFCSVGCKQKLTAKGDLLVRALPAADKEKDALLCMKGRFGFGEITDKERITAPMIGGKEATYEEAYVYADKSLQALQTQYGPDCIGVAVSDRLTNEEAFLIKEYAEKALKTKHVFCLNRREGGVAAVLGRDGSTATLDELVNTDLIVVVGGDLMKNHAVAGMKIRRAVEGGAKLLLLASRESLLDDVAALRLDAGLDLGLLGGVAKAIAAGKGKDLAGYAELAAWLEGCKTDERATAAAEMILAAKKAVFVFEKNALSMDGGALVADIALLSGHAFGPRNGVLQLLPGANAQGIADLGIAAGDAYRKRVADGTIKGLFVFGEDVPGLGLDKLEFLAVQELHRTATARAAHVVFPASSFAEIHGTFTSADGKVQAVQPVVAAAAQRDSFTQVKELAAQAGASLPYRNTGDVTALLAASPTVEPAPTKLIVPAGNALGRDTLTSTNALYVSLMEFAAKNGL